MSYVYVVWAQTPTSEYMVSIHVSVNSAIDKVRRWRQKYPDTKYYWEEEILWL